MLDVKARAGISALSSIAPDCRETYRSTERRTGKKSWDRACFGQGLCVSNQETNLPSRCPPERMRPGRIEITNWAANSIRRVTAGVRKGVVEEHNPQVDSSVLHEAIKLCFIQPLPLVARVHFHRKLFYNLVRPRVVSCVRMWPPTILGNV